MSPIPRDLSLTPSAVAAFSVAVNRYCPSGQSVCHR